MSVAIAGYMSHQQLTEISGRNTWRQASKLTQFYIWIYQKFTIHTLLKLLEKTEFFEQYEKCSLTHSTDLLLYDGEH